MKIKVEDIQVGDTLLIGVVNPTPYFIRNIVTEPATCNRTGFRFKCTFFGEEVEYKFFSGRTVNIKDR